MRRLIILFSVVLIALCVALGIKLLKSPPASKAPDDLQDEAAAATSALPKEAAPLKRTRTPQRRTATEGAEEQKATPPEPVADLFKKKLEQDRQQLGEQKHRTMEQLYADARKKRGEEASIKKLEQLLEEYPDTNRAGCAALELGHQHIINRKGGLSQSRKNAARYWQLSVDRYKDSICEHNASTPVRAKLSLATKVYRYTNLKKTYELLEEIAKDSSEVTPQGRVSPAHTAKRLLQVMTKAPASPK